MKRQTRIIIECLGELINVYPTSTSPNSNLTQARKVFSRRADRRMVAEDFAVVGRELRDAMLAISNNEIKDSSVKELHEYAR